MQQYSIYIMGLDGNIEERMDLSCLNDGDALQQAEGISLHRVIELWQASRFIATVAPRPTIFDV